MEARVRQARDGLSGGVGDVSAHHWAVAVDGCGCRLCAHVGSGGELHGFPSMRWPQLYRILTRAPLNYSIERPRNRKRKGSHQKLVADGRPDLRVAFHDQQEIPGGLVREILVVQVGLSEDEARQVIRGKGKRPG